MTDDPFDELGDASDREGDPFDQFESDDEDASGDATADERDSGGSPADETASNSDTAVPGDPFEDSGVGDARDDTRRGPDPDDPFAGLDRPPGDADPGLFDGRDGGDSDGDAGLFDDGATDTTGDGRAESRESSTGTADGAASSPGDGWFEGDMDDAGGAGGEADGSNADDGIFDDDTRVEADVGDPFAGSSEGVPLDEAESVFEEAGTEAIDPDTVWEQLGESPPAADSGGDTYAEVSKHTYCEQCEHFSPPPDVSCTHGGTEILAFLDMDTVRVVNCPVVAERRALQEQE